ncbi:MAG: BamA/TamA family outer membrane protein, partial [Bacteroidota bacterium]|nr:BamA/TamA family outer membrane protein [Bacteroidota bacterium]
LKHDKPDQYRVTINFVVIPGKQVKLDSISYNIQHEELQRLTDSAKNETFIKKGDAFAKPAMSAELDRLVELYRNNGYLRFTRDELVGVWDTLDASLLRPVTDPLEQIQLLTKLQKRRENPTADLEIRLRPGFDTSKLLKYYIGSITVYPDFSEDTVNHARHEVMAEDYRVIYYGYIFKPKFLPPNIYLKKGELYSQRKYVRTINRFNTLTAWKLVNIEQQPRENSDTVDFIIRLTPARKYLFDANLEGSRNQSVFAGNLLGTGVNIGIQNRNFARASNQANTNIRYGTELTISKGENIVQSQQASFSHNIYFPRSIPNFRWVPDRFKENFQTVFSFALANTDRLLLYNLTSLNASWGYDYKWKNKAISVKLPNFEYSLLNRRDSLDTLIKHNPSLANIFNDGLVISNIGRFTMTGGKTGTNIFRASLEESGLLVGMIQTKFFDTNLYRFIKLDAEFSRSRKYSKKEFAYRFFVGLGYELNSTVHPDKKLSLPFFKQFYAGGPNSMRAWGLRRLGPGSTVKAYSEAPDRFGDIQLEANVEFRFPLFTYRGVKFNSALFADAGNVWLYRPNPAFPDGDFELSRLIKDIAVGVGTGLRVDFNFFLIRLDYAYKAKNPSPQPDNSASQNKWFYNWQPLDGQVQLGINYPF